MKPINRLVIVIFLAFILIPFFIVRADTIDDQLNQINQELKRYEEQLEMSLKATKPLEVELRRLQSRLVKIRLRVGAIEKDIAQKEKEVKKGEEALVYQKRLLDLRTRSYYKNVAKTSFSLLQFLAAEDLAVSLRSFFYQRALVDEDRRMIVRIVLYIKDLEERKGELESEKARLAEVKRRIDNQSRFLAGEIGKAKQYQAELRSKIAQLTLRQKKLIAQKLASLNLPSSLGAGPLYCTDDRKLDPGFSPGFAFYTFGIPHRVGMNQYGALGRAQAGQPYRDILQAYFSGISFEKRDPNTRIKVQGYGEMGLDEYLLGVYEMPDSWPLEALKAQAVAARSYALAYTNNGEKEICTSQKCQVYKGGNKGGNWEKAVKETAGEVMVYNGQVISAWYASTAGGYTFKSSDVGWSDRPWTKRVEDTAGSINSFDDLFSKAYDKQSPCFYAAQGWRTEYNKSAWLKPEEVADIANVILLAREDPSVRDHLYQLDRPNPVGEDNWDIERVKSELRKRGVAPFNRASSVAVSADFGLGKTTRVTIFEGGRSEGFSGDEFKDWFNLRAPANIQIVGPLYKVEKR